MAQIYEADFHSNQFLSLNLFSWFGSNTFNLRKLRFAGNFLQNLDNAPFVGFENIEFVDLSKNGLQALRNESFSGLDAVERLVLSDNFISTIDFGSFHNLPMLTDLRLDGNKINSLSSDLFAHLPSLETLFIGDNSFTTLPRHFVTSSSLSYINFEDGKVQTVEDFAFEKTPNLRTLQLAYNDIYYVNDNGFSTTNESLVTTLDISHNSITEIPIAAIAKLTKVQFIDLSYNPLYSLSINESQQTQALEQLAQLYLSFSNINEVTDNSIFLMTPNLKTVLLNDCQFTELPVKVFLRHVRDFMTSYP